MKGSKLDEHRAEIIKLLERGVPKVRIAKELSVNPASLYYWLNTRSIPFRVDDDAEKPELLPYAERITVDITSALSNEIYRLCSREMEGIEHANLWLGNGHHAAQQMWAEIMETLRPVLKKVIHAKVLR